MSAATATANFHPSFSLPWAMSTEEDRRFRRILLITLALLMLFGLILPYLPVSEIEPPPVKEEVAKRYVRLLPSPPEPTPVPTPAPQLKAPAAKQAEIAQQPAPKPAPAPAPSAAPEKPSAGPENAREQAQQSGILAMRDSLASLRKNSAGGRLNDGPLSSAGSDAKTVERSILTSKVASGSNGINVSKLSRGFGGNGGGGGLGNRTTTQVQSPIGISAGGGSGGGTGRSNKMASRTDEEIQLVFDRNKGSIFGIYNRSLRTNSALQGKMVLRMTITPAGDISDIGVVSSELGDKELERKLLLRIKQFNFGAKEVETVTVTYPIEFFPS